MKKLLVCLLTAIVAATCAFTFIGCDEIENGSKITRIKIELEVYDASGNVTTTTEVYAKLYLNYAPNSTKQIVDLVNEGFYNGTCISNINSNWLEFGQYVYDENGLLAKKDCGKDPVDGEFPAAGITGNMLTTSKGAIVFKRNYDDATLESSYDTAKSALAICFSSSAASTFDDFYYCILGKVVDDDADEDADTELEQKSSIEKLQSLTEYKENEDEDGNTVVTYYYETENAYYTKWTDEDSNEHYALGTAVDSDNELKGKDLEDYKKLYNDNKDYFLVVPAVKLVIKNVSVCK